MINPTTLLPYGVERPRTLREYLKERINEVGTSELTSMEFKNAVRIKLIAGTFFERHGYRHGYPKGFENVYGGKY